MAKNRRQIVISETTSNLIDQVWMLEGKTRSRIIEESVFVYCQVMLKLPNLLKKFMMEISEEESKSMMGSDSCEDLNVKEES